MEKLRTTMNISLEATQEEVENWRLEMKLFKNG